LRRIIASIALEALRNVLYTFLLTYLLLVHCLKVMLLVIREHQPLKVVIRQVVVWPWTCPWKHTFNYRIGCDVWAVSWSMAYILTKKRQR